MGRHGKFEEEEDAEDPVVWVDPEDSEDEEVQDVDEGASASKGLEDALLGRLAVGSADAKRISAAIRAIETQARKDADSGGRITNTDLRKINVRDQLFDPAFYLANIHKKTPLEALRQGVQQLQRAASSGGKVSRKTKDLVRYSFPKFVATQDALNRLLTELDGGGPGDPAARLAELSETLEVFDSEHLPCICIQSFDRSMLPPIIHIRDEFARRRCAGGGYAVQARLRAAGGATRPHDGASRHAEPARPLPGRPRPAGPD
jgi:hypothetical protein